MIVYILKSILISLLLLLIYKLFLAKNQSYQFNRYFLLFAVIASSIFPLYEQTTNFQLKEGSILLAGNKAIEQIELNEYYTSIIGNEASTNNLFWILGTIYILISGTFLFRYLRNLSHLYFNNFTRGSNIHDFQTYYHNNNTGIYSFFNRLYLPISYQGIGLNESIIDHERAHFMQLHSIDNLIAELYLIIFWFNPIAWIFNKQIKSNHEYLADRAALKNVNHEDYLQIILQQIKPSKALILTSNFSYLSTKNRIKMIQKNKKSNLKKSISVVLSLFVGIISLSLFAFKNNDIAIEIDQQISANTSIALFEKPSGIPIDHRLIKKISSEYGERVNPVTKEKKLHTGVDLIAAKGTPIMTTGSGTVIKAEYSKNYGNHIVIQHNAKYSTLYAHLNSMKVKAGDKVKMSDVIGIIGNTGKSLGIHLHYELIENGKKIDPEISID